MILAVVIEIGWRFAAVLILMAVIYAFAQSGENRGS